MDTIVPPLTGQTFTGRAVWLLSEFMEPRNCRIEKPWQWCMPVRRQWVLGTDDRFLNSICFFRSGKEVGVRMIDLR